jgi:hypothetical protein
MEAILDHHQPVACVLVAAVADLHPLAQMPLHILLEAAEMEQHQQLLDHQLFMLVAVVVDQLMAQLMVAQHTH